MSSSPLISVIVIAHNRRDFLDEALRSATSQTLDRQRYEVILVKNFHDSTIDSLCERLNIETIFTTAQPASLKFLEGIQRSRGDIFTFLDYDDRYRPGRLEYVLNEFEGDRSLGFLHNGLEFIGPGGEPLTSDLDLHFRLMALHRRRVLIPDNRKASTNPRVGTARPGFNTGAIAVRREVMDLARPYLEQISIAVDSLLFCAGWIAPLAVLVDPTKLTQYRIHESNVSVASGMPGDDSNARQSRLNSFRQTLRQDYAVLLEMAARTGRTELQRDLTMTALYDRVLEELRRSTLGRRDAAQQLVNFSKYFWPGSLSTGLLQATACAAVASVSPRLARKLLRQSG
jgi:glycosyltransferase involved in cell wall biosynthesis